MFSAFTAAFLKVLFNRHPKQAQWAIESARDSLPS